MTDENWGRRDYPVDIIVRTNANDRLLDCLESIRRNTERELYGLTVVGVATNCTADMLPSSETDCVVWLRKNMGAVRATNVGLMMSWINPSKFVLVMDDDARIPDGDEDWLERWIEYFDDEKVGAVGATSDRVAGGQNVEIVPRTYARPWKNEKDGREGQAGVVDAGWLVSFACMYRKSALAKMYSPKCGGECVKVLDQDLLKTCSHGVSFLWDERFEPGNCEDVDVSIRLRLAGYRLRVARSIYVHHDCHQTFKSVVADLSVLLEVNRQKLAEKWGDILRDLSIVA